MAGFNRRLAQLSAQLDHHHSPRRPATLLRSSASLIIIQPLPSITADGFNYQTLLIQRNPTQRSFSAAHVFPGGNLDQGDHHYHAFLSRTEPAPSSDPTSSNLQNALKLCAVRETFEEAGVLVGLSSGMDIPRSVLADFREKLNDKTTQFSRIIEYLQSHAPGAEKKQGKIIDLDGLSHYANILTPTVFSKRWDTHFYLAVLPSHSGTIEGEEHFDVATPDQSETVSVVWLSPAEALKRSLPGTASAQSDPYITLPPPQFYLLTELARWKDYRQLMDHNRHRTVCPFTPELVKLSPSEGLVQFFIAFPGDPLHPSSPDLYRNMAVEDHGGSLIHRIHVRQESSDFGSQPGQFFRPLRLQRSGMHRLFGKGWEDLVD
ncbi:hypothetical protein PCANC_18329 [Puccinia coronata f. sp. avenae]|uniref:Nudix hydrolase domain-containing protein n=1 Tax=Puccinia coronata f. sp. avenae TaxID=200324 RepID=A0A2N5V059_9BASI|nr:hypothetical protein PCANC_18329 [Puccinia coronata f. sp. avenae]PLW43392.1 hypothetical protein PCASD_07501 [Puccinia coronata f. sp. avenae]